MTVRELIQWLAEFEDQDATVEVIEHESVHGWYEQGGRIRIVEFDPAKHAGHAYYTHPSTLLLGSTD
jgi:hypothetical protein